MMNCSTRSACSGTEAKRHPPAARRRRNACARLAGADLNGGKVAGADESAHGLGGELKLLGDVGDGQESCAHTTMIPLLDPLHNS